MKNIALCFDQSGEQSASGADTNIKALLALLDDSAALTWYHCARKLPDRKSVV